MNLVELKNDPVVPVTCLSCRAMVWHWPGGTDSQGRALTLDLIREPGQEPCLLVHTCHYEEFDRDHHGDFYDPDYYDDELN